MAISSLLKSKGITPDITSIASRLADDVSLIGSDLQYDSCVWQIGNKDNLDKLNTVQRKGLSIILGLPSTASLEAMKVMSGVIPLDFRREEIAIRHWKNLLIFCKNSY
jgi:hypothetical protein